jgi:hypothetical protein
LPYHGSYRILEVLPNGLFVCLVDRPEASSIRVSMEHCTFNSTVQALLSD